MSDRNPDSMELRKFGLMFAVVLAGLFGLLIPLLRHGVLFVDWPLWPWYACGLIIAWALLHPCTLWLLHTPWMKFAAIAQWFNTRVIMLLLFYLLILPIGLLLRLFGKDPMHRRFDPAADSYRIPADAQPGEHMENPY